MGYDGVENMVGSFAVARRALSRKKSYKERSILRSSDGISCLLLASMIVAVWPSMAHAYRPFYSTDPAVAAPKEFEIELSPLSFRRNNSGQTWISPQLKLNYGFAPNWELVVEGEGEHPRGSRSTLVGNAAFLKTVVREGTLQERLGPSAALELGVLLPGVNDENGFGASWAGIVGGQWDWGAAHFNVAANLTRSGRAEMFLGTIIEGPSDWAVRPVAELVYEREFGMTEVVAGLVGVIWEAKDDLAFDFAVRQADVNGQPETEIRLGLTFAFSVR